MQQWFRPMGTQRTWGQHARHCLLIAVEDVIEEDRRPERLQDDLLCWAFGMTGAVQARERERERERMRERETERQTVRESARERERESETERERES